MIRRDILVLAFLSALGSLLTGTVGAQDSTSGSPRAVPAGTYQPFDTWQKIQLGATSLVNPSVAHGAAVVYSFPFKSSPIVAFDKMKRGDAVFAKRMPDGRYATLSGDELKAVIGKLQNGESVDDVAVLTYQKVPPANSDQLILWPMSSN